MLLPLLGAAALYALAHGGGYSTQRHHAKCRGIHCEVCDYCITKYSNHAGGRTLCKKHFDQKLRIGRYARRRRRW
jgi:hypothetical protein